MIYIIVLLLSGFNAQSSQLLRADPAGMIVAAGGDNSRLLLTTGTDAGLAVVSGTEIRIISTSPGAGRNAFISNGNIFWKECPADAQQRILVRSDGVISVLLEGESVTGPFRSPDCVLAGDGEHIYILRNDIFGPGLKIDAHSPSAAFREGTVFYVDCNGLLRFADVADGTEGRIYISDELATLEISNRGYLLLRMIDGRFSVLNPDGTEQLSPRDGMWPRFTPEGLIVYIGSDSDNHTGSSTSIRLVDPDTGKDRALHTMLNGAVRPFLWPEHGIVYTDPITGELDGTGVPECVRSFAFPPDMMGSGERGEPAFEIDVPYLHQRWDTPDWFPGSWSCGPSSCTMAAQYYDRLTPDSIWCSSPSPGHWSRWGNYIPDLYTFLGHTYDDWGEAPGGTWVQGVHGFICPTGGAWWNLMVDWLTQTGLYSAWAGTSWGTLTSELDDSWPVVCSSTILYGGSTYGHIILFTGYFIDHTVIVNDPFGDANFPGWGESWQYPNGKACLYDWPGYNNGHLEIYSVNQLITARHVVFSEPDTLVDDYSHGFEKLGSCEYWHEENSGYDSHMWWTYSTGAEPDTCFVKWKPLLPAPGQYEVLAFIPDTRATATGLYRLSTDNGIEVVSLDQSLFSSEWASLGEYPLSPGDSLYLGDYTGTSGQYIAFDAVRFHPLPTSVEEGDNPGTQSISIYPNPGYGSSIVHLPGGINSSSVVLLDLAGRIVERHEINPGDTDITVGGNLPRGTYIVLVRSGSESCKRKLLLL